MSDALLTSEGNPRVLVTGANGFIGRHVASALKTRKMVGPSRGPQLGRHGRRRRNRDDRPRHRLVSRA
ncbi:MULTISPECIES: NAD-dependent epimerase/dehydratase family protein [unclassified Bradyrhizobium]